MDVKQYEYECICGYVWIDDQNYGCPMCGAKEQIVRREYTIKQPCEFDRQYKKRKILKK